MVLSFLAVTTLIEFNRLKSEIAELEHRQISNVPIKYGFKSSGLDGKARVLANKKKSMANCLNCGAKPSRMAKPKHLGKFVLKAATLEFGLSAMHLRNLSMQWFCKFYLHQDFKSWSTPDGFMFLKKERLAELQYKAKDELGLNLYKPNPGGAGNSNSGNTSRKCFAFPDTFARIVETSPDLVKGIGKLINALNSTRAIDADKLESHCQDILDYFHNSEYEWNWMSHSVHAAVHHGPDLVR